MVLMSAALTDFKVHSHISKPRVYYFSEVQIKCSTDKVVYIPGVGPNRIHYRLAPVYEQLRHLTSITYISAWVGSQKKKKIPYTAKKI